MNVRFRKWQAGDDGEARTRGKAAKGTHKSYRCVCLRE